MFAKLVVLTTSRVATMIVNLYMFSFPEFNKQHANVISHLRSKDFSTEDSLTEEYYHAGALVVVVICLVHARYKLFF